MPKRITINVTQQDIDESVPVDCTKSPLALAAQRSLERKASIGLENLIIGTRLIPLSKKARDYRALEMKSTAQDKSKLKPARFAVTLP